MVGRDSPEKKRGPVLQLGIHAKGSNPDRKGFRCDFWHGIVFGAYSLGVTLLFSSVTSAIYDSDRSLVKIASWCDDARRVLFATGHLVSLAAAHRSNSCNVPAKGRSESLGRLDIGFLDYPGDSRQSLGIRL